MQSLETKLFGVNVRRRRIELGLSQEELAERSQSHRNYIGAVERGERNITLIKAFCLAKALNCTLIGLLEGVASPKTRGKGGKP